MPQIEITAHDGMQLVMLDDGGVALVQCTILSESHAKRIGADLALMASQGPRRIEAVPDGAGAAIAPVPAEARRAPEGGK